MTLMRMMSMSSAAMRIQNPARGAAIAAAGETGPAAGGDVGAGAASGADPIAASAGAAPTVATAGVAATAAPRFALRCLIELLWRSHDVLNLLCGTRCAFAGRTCRVGGRGCGTPLAVSVLMTLAGIGTMAWIRS
jgi:hypothetical protein